MRIGLVSDTHCDADELPSSVLEALAGVDLIIHCGDVGFRPTLDLLETVAPVVGIAGNVDRAPDDRLAERPRVVDAGGLAIGVARALEEPWAESIANTFEQPVQVVALGGHRPVVEEVDGVLVVCPGSPTYPGKVNEVAGDPTVAVLEILDGRAEAHVVTLPARAPTAGEGGEGGEAGDGDGDVG